jgi:hypothetical protein
MGAFSAAARLWTDDGTIGAEAIGDVVNALQEIRRRRK